MGFQTASQIIVLKSPDLSGDSRLTDFIGLAKQQLSSANFGLRYEYAVALLVLHWITLDSLHGGSESSSGSGGSGAVKSEKEGDLSRSYGDIATSAKNAGDAYYMQTAFGSEFLALRRSQIIPMRNRFITRF